MNSEYPTPRATSDRMNSKFGVRVRTRGTSPHASKYAIVSSTLGETSIRISG